MKSPISAAVRGFTLVELLVAVFIFAVGFLGITKMHALSIKQEIDNGQRIYAAMMVTEMTNRMRANTAGTYAGDYKAAAAALSCDTVPSKICSDSNLGTTEVCNAAEIAKFDVWELSCGSFVDGVTTGSNSQLLLQSMTMTCSGGATCPAGNEHTITVVWRSKASELAEEAMQDQSLSHKVLM